MARCWESSRATGSDLLVLLALADAADDDGECWPSVRTIAKKARLDHRTTQRRIRSLQKLGEVEIRVNGGQARTPGGVKSNRYRITI